MLARVFAITGAVAAVAPATSMAQGPNTVPVQELTSRVHRGLRAAPYRHERYRRQCREDAALDAPEATLVHDRSEARRRAITVARRGAIDPVLLFARVVYGETGTPYPGRNDDLSTPRVDEYEAILAVIDQRRGERNREEMLATYAPRRIFPSPEDARQRWIAELQLDGRRPPSWPRALGDRQYPGWRSYGCPRWLAAVDAAREVWDYYRGRPIGVGPCDEAPDHWGGRMDDPRAIQSGWRRVSCGRTRNNFWIVPRASSS